MEDWLPPLDGEEPEELKDAEEEAAGESGNEDDEETESESPPPAEAPVARKTRQQTLKELAQKNTGGSSRA